MTDKRINDLLEDDIKKGDVIAKDNATTTKTPYERLVTKNHLPLNNASDIGVVLSGSITLVINDSPNSTFTTSVDHNLAVGNTVTISGTTSYNGSFVILSVTANTFTILVTFVADESGTYTTDVIKVPGALGVGTKVPFLMAETFTLSQQLLLQELGLFLSGYSSDIDIINYAGASPSMIRFDDGDVFKANRMGFNDTTFSKKFNEGTAKPSTFTSFFEMNDCQVTFFNEMPNLESFLTVSMRDNFYLGNFTNGVILKDIIGTEVIGDTFFTLSDGARTYYTVDDSINAVYAFNRIRLPIRASETAFRIVLGATGSVRISDSTIGTAGTPFDLSNGGLDQTDPRVIAVGNDGIVNSMASAEIAFKNEGTPITVTIGTTGTPVLIGGTEFSSRNLERAETTTAGRITNKAKKTQKYQISIRAVLEKSGGGTAHHGLMLIKNGDLTPPTGDILKFIPISLTASDTEVSAGIDIELAENDFIELAVVQFTGTSDIIVTQASISYSRTAI